MSDAEERFAEWTRRAAAGYNRLPDPAPEAKDRMWESIRGSVEETVSSYGAADYGLRKVKRFRSREAELDEAGEVGSVRREAEPDLKVRLARAIDALPEIYRSVFIMYDVEGHTHEGVAAALGIPSGTSKARLSVARAKLREALADFAGEWIA